MQWVVSNLLNDCLHLGCELRALEPQTGVNESKRLFTSTDFNFRFARDTPKMEPVRNMSAMA